MTCMKIVCSFQFSRNSENRGNILQAWQAGSGSCRWRRVLIDNIYIIKIVFQFLNISPTFENPWMIFQRSLNIGLSILWVEEIFWAWKASHHHWYQIFCCMQGPVTSTCFFVFESMTNDGGGLINLILQTVSTSSRSCDLSNGSWTAWSKGLSSRLKSLANSESSVSISSVSSSSSSSPSSSSCSSFCSFSVAGSHHLHRICPRHHPPPHPPSLSTHYETSRSEVFFFDSDRQSVSM